MHEKEEIDCVKQQTKAGMLCVGGASVIEHICHAEPHGVAEGQRRQWRLPANILQPATADVNSLWIHWRRKLNCFQS